MSKWFSIKTVADRKLCNFFQNNRPIKCNRVGEKHEFFFSCFIKIPIMFSNISENSLSPDQYNFITSTFYWYVKDCVLAKARDETRGCWREAQLSAPPAPIKDDGQ